MKGMSAGLLVPGYNHMLVGMAIAECYNRRHGGTGVGQSVRIGRHYD